MGFLWYISRYFIVQDSLSMSRKNCFLVVLNLLLAGSFSMLAARMFVAMTDGYFFLLWNLFLAAIPYAFAVAFERIARKSVSMTWSAWVVFFLWLFFFPNAPYIVTDFVHLPWEYMWSRNFIYDFSLIAVFAVTGLLLGMGALFRVHRVLRRMIGDMWAGFMIVSVIFLSGVGMYLGRFLRWNSWDAFLNPLEMLRDTVSHYGDPVWFGHAVTLSCFFAVFIGLSYLLFVAAYWLLGLRENRARECVGRNDE